MEYTITYNDCRYTTQCESPSELYGYAVESCGTNGVY